MCISGHGKQIVEGSSLVPSNFKETVNMGTPIREARVPVHLLIYVFDLRHPGFAWVLQFNRGQSKKSRWKVVFFAGGRVCQDISIWNLSDILAIHFK